MYKDLLESDGISYSCHVSSFTGRLKSVSCFSDDVNEIIKAEIGNESLAKCLLKIVTPICKQMAEIRNMLDGLSRITTKKTPAFVTTDFVCLSLMERIQNQK